MLGVGKYVYTDRQRNIRATPSSSSVLFFLLCHVQGGRDSLVRARRSANWKDGTDNGGNAHLLELGGTVANNLGVTLDPEVLVLEDGNRVDKGVGGEQKGQAILLLILFSLKCRCMSIDILVDTLKQIGFIPILLYIVYIMILSSF